jgi:Zn finger protein HypA/HybF involved in hydrogenase expression
LSDHFVQTQAGFNPSKFLEAAAPAQHMELPKAASAGLTLYQQVMASLEADGMRKGAPFADYEDFDDCTSQNSDKRDPDAYCGEVQRRTEKSGNLAQYARMLNLRESNRSASADLRGVSAEERAWYLPQLFAAHRAATGEDWTSTEGLRRVQADEDSLGFNDGRSEGFARSVCAKAGAGPSRVASSVYEDDVLAVEAAGNRLAGRLLRALWHLESLGVIRESSGQQSWGQSGWDGSKVVPTGTQIQQSAQALRSALSQLSTSLRIRDREAGIANLGRALVSAGAPLGLIAYCGEIKHKTEDKKESVRHTAPGGGEHAPYRIEEEDGKFYVVNDLGERKNEDGYSSREEAREFQKALYKNVPGAAESAKEDEKKKASVINEEAFRRRPPEASLRRTAALDPTQMQPGDSVTVHYHTADGKSGTCPATFKGPVEDDPTEDEDQAAPAAAPVATASKTAAFPPAAAPAQQAPVDPADVDPAATGPITYAFDYANGTFYVSDDGTGQWVDPAGSTFTFSAGDEGEDPVEDVAEEEEDNASDGGSDAKDDNAPPWAKKSSKEAAAALRCTHCGGAVEPENIDPDWGDLQICRNCEHQARLRGPAADPNEELRQFREMHTPREEEPSAEWLDRHSKKTAANPFLPGNNRFTGPANPYLTPTPPGASDDTSADTGTATPDDQAMAVMPPPGTSGVVQPTTAPVGAPGGNQEAHTVPQNITPPTQRASKLTAAVGVVCTGCGLQGEVALTHLARLVREGAELGCPRCGSFEVDAIDKEAVEDFSDFSAPKDPSDGSMSLPLANELHDVARVSEMARCSNCFHTFETTASNPADPIPNCPRCGSKATTVAGGWKGKLSSMVASVKTSNPGISAEDATALAERALALAGG